MYGHNEGTTMTSENLIGVFDSGMGGLGILRELRRQMPNEHYLYLGDSARNPYGSRSIDAVRRFTLEAAGFLKEAGAKAMVIACNTATVAGLEAARRAHPEMPVIGVVEPGCIAATAATRNGHIVLVATRATVASGAHAARINELRPGTKVTGVAAPIFVTLVEEGWLDGAVPDAVARRYLSDLFDGPEGARPDCLILACTHFTALRESIRKAVGGNTVLVDPAEMAARQARVALDEHDILRRGSTPGTTSFCVTADPERFARVSALFLQTPLTLEEVRIISLG